jgi:hypothetical protein
MLALLGALIGGWIGWATGAQLSFFAAFILSIIGTGAGIYFARRFARNYS